MVEYIKIETLFNRDIQGTKKLVEGDYRNETVEFLKDNTWICTEKIDGTNIGIVWDGHKISFQGRTERSNIPTHLVNFLNSKFMSEEVEQLFEQKFGDMNVILFGEGYGTKIQKSGNYYRDDVSFILFDVYAPKADLWLRRDDVEDIAKCFDIEVVPIILEGTLQDAIDYVKTRPKSTIGTADMEGLVCRPKMEVFDRLGKRVIAKVRVGDFALC